MSRRGQTHLVPGHNPDYATTNMVSTLMCAADLLDVIIAYGDIVYQTNVMEALVACPEPYSTTIDLQWQKLWEVRNENPLNDAETLRLDDQLNVLELGKKSNSLKDIEGQYMGLIKVQAQLAREIVNFYNQLDKTIAFDGKAFANMYMTSFPQSLIDAGYPLRAVAVSSGWLEIDTVADLELFEDLQRRGDLAQYCQLN
jgi:choline kinase